MNTADKPVKPVQTVQTVQTVEERELDEKSAKLAETMAKADREYRAYLESKHKAEAFEQLAKCNKISNHDYEQMFFRYMAKKHPAESQQVFYDPSPVGRRLTKMFADIFMSEEVVPRSKEFYLTYGRCPSLNDLNFPY